MNREQSFNPNRLEFARKRRGYKITELSKKLDITTRTYSHYSNGHSSPSEDLLQNMSSVLKFPVHFFCMEDIHPVSADAVSFRSLSRMSASIRDMAICAGQIAIEFSSFVETKFELPKVKIPDLRGVEPEAAASYVRNEWLLGEKTIKNFVHLLEAMGCRVFSLNENTHDMDAYSFWMDSQPYVFLNTRKSVEHSRFDCAHELGHLVLHKHGAPRGKEVENEANRFASSFLMPAGSVNAIVDRYPTLTRLISLKRNWLVSLSALGRRLKDLGLLSDWQYRSLMIEMSKRGFLKAEPEPIKQRETSQLLPMILNALKEEGISKRDLARELGVNISDIDVLMFNLTALSVMEGQGTKTENAKRNSSHLRQVK